MKTIQVSLAIIKKIVQNKPYFLTAWRDKGKHQGNCYEFIGGKVEANETARQALERECLEEIGIKITQTNFLTTISHHYDDINIDLHIFNVIDYNGIPTGKEGQSLHWIDADTLKKTTMPAANDPIKRLALLSEHYVISKQVSEFSAANPSDKWLDYYEKKIPLYTQFYFRDKQLNSLNYLRLSQQLKSLRPDVNIIANFTHHHAFQKVEIDCITGFHLSHNHLIQLNRLTRISANHLYIAACHDATSIKKANELQIDAITISPINKTKTHLEAQPIGWESFKEFNAISTIPSYALGGMTMNDLTQVRQCKGFGIAGISLITQQDFQ